MSSTDSANNTNINGLVSVTDKGISFGDVKYNNMTVTLPDPETAAKPKDTKSASQVITEAGNKISDSVVSANRLIGGYSSLVTKVNQLTGLNLPTIKSGSPIAKILDAGNKINNATSTILNNQYGERVQSDSVNPQPGAFKWAEEESIPGDFISYDSVLLFTGAPLYKDNAIGERFKTLGYCQNFNISSGVQVTTIQELRCEEQLVFPGKTQPINISMNRLCGVWSNLPNRLHGNTTRRAWNCSLQYDNMRDLFGLYVLVLDTSRRNVVSSFYVERCAITAWQFGVAAGNYQVLENCSIIGGRIIDTSHVVSPIPKN